MVVLRTALLATVAGLCCLGIASSSPASLSSHDSKGERTGSEGARARARELISRQECQDQGGTVVGDIGNGAIHQLGYTCETSGEPPVATIEPGPEEPIAFEGEVCCANSTSTADEGPSLGNGGPDNGGTPLPPNNGLLDRPTLSRQECTQAGGTIVGDIGNGAIHQADYVCEANGEPPYASIAPAEGEPVAFEGEVCCGVSAPPAVSDRPEMTRQECEEEQDGIVVGDIGDGAIHHPDYACEASGEAPIGTIVVTETENVPIEGEVCCAKAAAIDSTSSAAVKLRPWRLFF